MEVKNPLAFLAKHEYSHTKTFVTNLVIGLIAFAIFSGIAVIAQAQEEDEMDAATEASRCETLLAGDEGTEPQRRFCENLLNQQEKQEELKERKEEMQAQLDERREEMNAKKEELQEKMEERKEEFASRTEAVREKIEERKAALSERTKDRIIALAHNVSEKMQAAIGRLEQIITRFETRIEKLETQGVDGSAAQTKLDEAREYLSTATSIVENEADGLVDATLDSETPRDTWNAARTKYSEAREALRNAHTAIKDALALLKDAVAQADLGRGVSDAVTNAERSDTSDTNEEEDTEETNTDTNEESTEESTTPATVE